ncbi:SMI1/KNR4 family protein [Nocardia otitidiscaviarum]|uniref:SMI1/KNR4 family protein n=1 Tax=Nocardia otitidiscaviarum TaxID=1823 RepID=UPI00163D5A21|nr:SMI1/KNR4 family protein [Nocardia otitidiscaviarum]MCP9620807.1 SMI1/KNR4 family protein [Nocardia otitidiscaviarum]
MTHPAPRTFDHVWTRFLHQLGRYSPASVATLQPGATAEQIAQLEAGQGFALHPDVRALLEHHNGTVYVDGNAVEGAEFLPMAYMLDSIDRILDGHEWRTTFSAENRASGMPEEALYGHAHQWVPIAHSIDAGILFVEHRPGPTYGHAFEGTLWAAKLPIAFGDTDSPDVYLDQGVPGLDQIPVLDSALGQSGIELHDRVPGSACWPRDLDGPPTRGSRQISASGETSIVVG